jgi:uncharacterized protein YfdQ (DUF2303 family)
MSETNQAETIAELALQAIVKPVTFTANGNREFVVLPRQDGAMELKDITLPNSAAVVAPQLVSQHVKLHTPHSLTDYVNRFKNDDSVVFADIAHNRIETIIDYHRQPLLKQASLAPPDPAHNPTATLSVHRASLTLPFSLEWQTWTGISGKLMSHQAFATFLEENAVDIKNPVGADLLELCRDLQVANNVNFSSSVRMGDITKFEYAKDNDAKTRGDIALPSSIMLSIPVYFGEPPVAVMAYMRRKIDDGALYLGVQLSRAENVRQDEFHRIVGEVSSEVGLTHVYGTPA